MSIKKSQFITRQSGFTLLEVLLTITLMGIIFTFTIPFYQSFRVNNNLDVSANVLAQSLYRAQIFSQAVAGDAPWGIRIQANSIVLFQGTDYANRDTSLDEIYELPTGIILTGLSEIVFAKLSGTPNLTGAIIFSNNFNNKTKTVWMNEKGIVFP
jgi:prepilin-type N-terminal cleavage/methylation domain-containing protein